MCWYRWPMRQLGEALRETWHCASNLLLLKKLSIARMANLWRCVWRLSGVCGQLDRMSLRSGSLVTHRSGANAFTRTAICFWSHM